MKLRDGALMVVGLSLGVLLSVNEIDRSGLDLIPAVDAEVKKNRNMAIIGLVGGILYLMSGRA